MKRTTLLLFIALFASAMGAWADVTGTILGTVVDPTGGVIIGAKVTLRNQNTGLTRSTDTDTTGTFQFLLVPVGDGYVVEVEAHGFQKSVESGITLEVNQSFRANFRLEVGTLAQRVEVTAAPVQVEATSTQVGDVITDTKMTTLPLNGRSYIDLLGLQAGVAPTSSDKVYTYNSLNVSGNLSQGWLSVNGNRETSNGFMINGGDVNDGLLGGTTIVPNLDSIQEFRVITNSFDAEYGRFSGSVVNVVTKSGTNGFHGSAFEFLRNNALDSRTFLEPTKSELKQNQFGGTLGGRIIKNRLFFFVDYQGTRQVSGANTFVQVPSSLERGGDFSDVGLTGLGQLTGVVEGSNTPGSDSLNQVLSSRLGYTVNPGEPYWFSGTDTNGHTCATLSDAQAGYCVFPNQMVPQSAWGPVAKATLSLIPNSNLDEAGHPIFDTSSYKGTLRDDKFGWRFDLNNQHTGNWSVYYHFDDSSVASPYSNSANLPGFGIVNAVRGQQVNLSNVYSFSSSMVNEARINFMRHAGYVAEPAGGFGKLTDFGFQQGGQGMIPIVPKVEGVPDFSFGQLGMSFGLNSYDTGNFNNTFQGTENLSKLLGRHTLKFGADFRYFQINIRVGCNPNGSMGFPGTQTGNDFADYLIGVLEPYSFLQCNPPALDTRGKFMSAYAQDSFKVKPNFTLNYGLRYEFSPPWFDTQGRIEQIVWGQQSSIYPDAPTGWLFPGDPGVPNTLAPPRYDNFAPRVGFAYSPGFSDGIAAKIFGGPGKTSIRAAFGMFYTAIEDLTVNYEIGVPPFAVYFINPTATYLEEPYQTINGTPNPTNPFPYNFPKRGSTGFWRALLPISDDQVYEKSNVLPYAEDFNFNIQRQIGNSATLMVAYVGNRGHHLLAQQYLNPGNQALCLQVRQILGPANGCGPYGEDQIYDLGNGQYVNGTRPHSVTSGRYLADGVLDFTNVGGLATLGNSSYDGLQVTLDKRVGAMRLLAAYSWSKALGNSSFLTDGINPYAPKLDKSLLGFDVRHNFVVSYIYDLPFAKLTSSKTGPAYKFLNGWEVAGITRFTTGQPVTIGLGGAYGDYSLIGSGSIPGVDEPDYDGTHIQFFNPRATSIHSYFSTTQFSPPPMGGFGTANQAFFRAPGINNWDLSLHKSLPINERLSTEFRAELFNAFNHAQFSGVDGYYGSSLFGTVGGVRSPRIGQIGLRFNF